METPASNMTFQVAPPNAASQIGIANLPNQRHRIVQRSGASFTLMLAGETGLGKTTFLNTLFTLELKKPMPHKKRFELQRANNVSIEVSHAKLEEKGFRLNLTIIDTPGFGDFVDNTECWEPVLEFIDDQHESYFRQEQQPHRDNLRDQRIHACLYFIKPTGHTLKPVDILSMKAICSHVNLIPVIAKSDTLSPKELAIFKKRIQEVITAHDIQVFLPPVNDDDPNSASEARAFAESMPYAIVGSTEDVQTPDGRVVKGRVYPWGAIEVENEHHCDFKILRDILLRKHMIDLIKKTEDIHYEQYRESQMANRKPGEPRPLKIDGSKFKEEEEALRRRFTDQVKLEEQRFRNWEQRLITERDRLNKDLEAAHSMIKQLEQEIDQLQKTNISSRKRG